MDYRLSLQDETVSVKLEQGTEEDLTCSIQGRTYSVKYERISENQIHVAVKGKDGSSGANVYLADGPNGKEIMVRGIPYVIRDADMLERRTSRKKARKHVPKIVTPPMPSTVVKILVETGERVAEGSGVIVVSAMKMETTLNAPFNGVVKRINVAVGDKAAPGDILMDIEKE